MKHLLLASAIFGIASLAFAGEDTHKIDTDFDSLDNNNDQYISQEEADDNNIWEHFKNVDTNKDGRLSKEEYVGYVKENPGSLEDQDDAMEEAE